MGYTVKHVAGDDKPWKIVNGEGAVVGSSESEEKAIKSMGYREKAENAKSENAKSESGKKTD